MATSQTSPPAAGTTVKKRTRRRFSAEYKLSILREADACTHAGQIGELLQREGLYSSNLAVWRKQRDSGLLKALLPKKRGRKRQEDQALSQHISKLKRENQRLQEKLRHAEMIIDAQKKVSDIVARSPLANRPKGH